MWKLTWRGLRYRPGRFMATVAAVVVGTAFLATALILRDSVSAALQANTDQSLAGVDAAVQPDLEAAEQRLVSDPKVPASLLNTVIHTAGVDRAAGVLVADIAFRDGTDTRSAESTMAPAGSARGSIYIEPDALNPYRLSVGSFPQQSGEVAIDRQSADRRNLSVGSTVALATTSGLREARVVGVVNYGAKPASSDFGDVVVSPADGFSWLGSGTHEYQFIVATAADGTSDIQLAANLAAAVGPGYQALDGAAFREQQSGGAAMLASTIGIALQVFAYVALFVGIFIIYNTFTVSVAQRQREFALLRAVGASGKQIRRTVLVESLVLALVSSVIGFGLGIGLVGVLTKIAPGLVSLGTGTDVRLSISVLVLAQVLLSGLIVTTVSAMVPAFRAARVRPIEALRDATVDRRSTSRLRTLTGTVVTVAGLGFTTVGALASQGLMLAAGPPLMFVGLLLAGPAVASRCGKTLAHAARRIGTTVGRVAGDNAARNPRRTATTANALLIGVFLVVFMTAAGGAVRDWGTQQLSTFSGPDLTVVANGDLPPNLATEVAETSGVEAVAPIYYNQGRADLTAASSAPDTPPTAMPVAAVDFAQLDTLGVTVTVPPGKAQLADDEVAVVNLFSSTHRVGLGEPVTITFPDGRSQVFKVGAQIDLSLVVPPVIISINAARAANPDASPSALGVKVLPGQVQPVQDILEDTVRDYSNVEILAGNSIASFFRAFIDALISAVNALLLVAVVIAVFGIINTLMLSIVERTHEIGLLRAVGMSRRQVWSTVQIEAMVVSMLGVAMGVASGLFVAWMVTFSLFHNDQTGTRAEFSWPVREMVVVVALGIVIGVAASLLPAIKATRLNPLEAIRAE